MEYLKRNVKAVAIIVLLLLIAAFITYSVVSPRGMFSGLKNDLKDVEAAVEGGYTDLDGNPVSLERFKGKVLVVNLWATWMPFSRDELKLLIELKQRYGDRIEIVAVNRMEEGARVRSYLATYGIGSELTFILDISDNFYRAVDGYAMPETLIYGEDGTLLLHKRGVLSMSELGSSIDAALTR